MKGWQTFSRILEVSREQIIFGWGWFGVLSGGVNKCGGWGSFRLRPGPRQPPAVWRASPAPRGGPSRCGRRSPECASSSRSTACAGSAAPSSPPRTERRGRPAGRAACEVNAWFHNIIEKNTSNKEIIEFSYTCLFAKMSNKASRSSFSVSSLASSLCASISRSLWQLSITYTTAGWRKDKRRATWAHRFIILWCFLPSVGRSQNLRLYSGKYNIYNLTRNFMLHFNWLNRHLG